MIAVQVTEADKGKFDIQQQEGGRNKGVAKSVGVESKWQYFRSQDGEFSCCNATILMEDEWEMSRRERKKVQPSNNIVILKEHAWEIWDGKKIASPFMQEEKGLKTARELLIYGHLLICQFSKLVFCS